MRFWILTILFFVTLATQGAARFWVGGGSSANWSATGPTNWAATSGGAGNQSVPGPSDDVTFDGAGATGNSNSTVSATITVLSLTFTSGYTQTVTLNAVPTIAGNFTDHSNHSWAGSSGITISAASTITPNSKTFPNAVTFSGANTKTLAGNWTVTGLLTMSANTVLNGNILTLGGGLTTAAGSLSGTTTVTFAGTGTWTGGAGASASIANPIIINTAGTITTSTNLNLAGGSITYTAGTVVNTNSTLNITASVTLNTNGINWNNVTITATAPTLTINSLFTVNGTLTVAASTSPTFAGTSGWTAANFTVLSIDARTITLANTVTYAITTAFTCAVSRVGGTALITSDHATNKAILTVTNGAACAVLAAFTRIDASGGRTIWTFNSTVTTCTNINSFTDLRTIGTAG